MYKAGQKVILKRPSEVRDQADRCGLPLSYNDAIGIDHVFVLSEKPGQNIVNNIKVWQLKGPSYGTDYGWVYEHELGHIVSSPDSNKISLQELEEEFKELEEKLDTLSMKIDWMRHLSATEFDEYEFKVYQVLKTLDDTKITTTHERAKLIATLLRE